jgi:predicted SAM-dependent methyltransferase
MMYVIIAKESGRLRSMSRSSTQRKASGRNLTFPDSRYLRVNIGCGATPTDGWINFDNSLTVRLARWPLIARPAVGRKILAGPSWRFAKVAIEEGIQFANATRRIPCANNSVEIAYSSHMIEHLDRREAQVFLREVKRILRPGGILRLAVPDISRLINSYLATGDADEFVASTHMSLEKSADILSRLRLVLIGPRHHLWMYDGRSLSKLLCDAGFTNVSIMPPGKTTIADPGSLNLQERAEQSVYIEAVRGPEITGSG